jgi:hypothetical protein
VAQIVERQVIDVDMAGVGDPDACASRVFGRALAPAKDVEQQGPTDDDVMDLCAWDADRDPFAGIPDAGVLDLDEASVDMDHDRTATGVVAR